MVTEAHEEPQVGREVPITLADGTHVVNGPVLAHAPVLVARRLGGTSLRWCAGSGRGGDGVGALERGGLGLPADVAQGS